MIVYHGAPAILIDEIKTSGIVLKHSRQKRPRGIFVAKYFKLAEYFASLQDVALRKLEPSYKDFDYTSWETKVVVIKLNIKRSELHIDRMLDNKHQSSRQPLSFYICRDILPSEFLQIKEIVREDLVSLIKEVVMGVCLY